MAEYTDNYGLIEPTYAELADIDPLNGNFETIDEIMHASQVSLADAYDLTATYNTGDVVMYQYYMYKCKEDNVTGAWDATKWERTTAGANGSGGGGTEVVANPVGTPTADLQTIEIAGTIYDIPGGGGSGGGGQITIEETALWTNPNGAGDGTFTLSDSIDNYDFINVRFGQWGDYTGSLQLCENRIFAVEELKALYTDGKKTILSGFGTRTIYTTWNGTTLECSNSTDGQIVLQVDGLKLKGAGGAGFSVESLWSGINSATMQLSKSFENYDAITVIATAVTAQGDYRLTNTWPVEYLKQHINDGIRFGLTGDAWYVYFSITNNTTFTRQDQSIVYISDIFGVNYGGGGAGASKEILYTNATNTNPATISLTDDYSNFDILSIRAFRNADSIPENSIFLTIDTQLLQINQVINILGWAGSNEFVLYKLTAANELTLIMQGSGIYIREIAGVKN